MLAVRPFALLATVVLVLAACSPTGADPYGGAAATPVAVPSASANVASATVSSSTSPTFGAVLTGPTGMTLYTHAGDTATSSTCSGACATAWPPLGTTGQPTAAAGVTGKLGTLVRADGTTQVTYDGLPLYYWEGDTKAGDVTGDGVEGFSVAKVGAAGAAAKPSAAPAKRTPPASMPDPYTY